VRILQVITDTDRRGAQVFALHLGVGLGALDHRVETVALAPGVIGGLAVPVLGSRRRSPGSLLALRRRMASADVTIAHGSTTGPLCALAGSGIGRPFVYRQISDSRFWAPTPTRRALVRHTLGRARLVVALSEQNRQDLVEWIGLPADRIRVVPNGAPAADFPPTTAATRTTARAALGLADRPTVVSVGALAPEKGVDLVIEAVAQVPGIQLLVAGDGPERGRLEQLARDRAPGRVHFAGPLARSLDAFHAADVVVLASRGGDVMPATLIEAGFCGLPTVATAVGAIADVVVDRATGFVVPPGDLAGFTAALQRLTDDAALRDELGAKARAHCLAHFDLTPVARAWAEVLAEVSDPARPRT